jgi:hypothetical protein
VCFKFFIATWNVTLDQCLRLSCQNNAVLNFIQTLFYLTQLILFGSLVKAVCCVKKNNMLQNQFQTCFIGNLIWTKVICRLTAAPVQQHTGSRTRAVNSTKDWVEFQITQMGSSVLLPCHSVHCFQGLVMAPYNSSLCWSSILEDEQLKLLCDCMIITIWWRPIQKNKDIFD